MDAKTARQMSTRIINKLTDYGSAELCEQIRSAHDQDTQHDAIVRIACKIAERRIKS